MQGDSTNETREYSDNMSALCIRLAGINAFTSSGMTGIMMPKPMNTVMSTSMTITIRLSILNRSFHPLIVPHLVLTEK